MFDIGFWEIFLIMVLALLVIGPERLPGAARTAGYWVGRARRFVEGVKSDVEQEFDITEFQRLMHNQEIQINELQRKLTQAGDLTGEDQPEHNFQAKDLPQSDKEHLEDTDIDTGKGTDQDTSGDVANTAGKDQS